MSRLSLLLPVLLLVGCIDAGSDQEGANRALMPAWNAYTVGDAASMRLWKTADGTTWMVIGPQEKFAVFTMPPGGKAWVLTYSVPGNVVMPPQLMEKL